MPVQLKNILILIGVVFVLVILWGVSIGITYWDIVSRRKLSGIETAAWMALVVLIPGIGFAAYLFARLIGGALSPKHPLVENPRRETLLKQSFEPEQRTGTIAAADLIQSTPTEAINPQKAWTGWDNGGQKYKISIIAGPNSGEEHFLEVLPVKIGRGMDVSIRLNEDYGVSRLHAEIYEQNGVLRIRDLNSTHGTKVNDIRINDKSLDPGDQIQVGISILRVDVEEEPA